MGLPSGLLWATCNIDITQEDGFAASPFQYGCTMFSWGNIEGHNTPASGTTFDYNWGGVNSQEPWYDGQPYGGTAGAALTTDIVAGDTQDAARYNLGSLFKMPSYTQFQELFDNCDFIDANGNIITGINKLTTVSGVVGIYLRSKINSNSLFFSASGFGNGSSWNNRGSYGVYWSASFHSSRGARHLYFDGGRFNPQDSSGRYNGFAVRAVVNPNTIDVGHNNHKYFVTKDINVDLTKMFGETIANSMTVELFEKLFPLPYYNYNEGQLLNVNVNALKTVGFNLYNNGTASVISGKTYYVDGTYTSLAYDDGTLITISNKEFTASKTGVITVTGSGADTIINLSDTSRNGIYEPYWTDTTDVPITELTGINSVTGGREVMFPNGLKSAGSIKDVIQGGTAIKRLEFRDYISADDSDSSVITDGTHTVAPLTTP